MQRQFGCDWVVHRVAIDRRPVIFEADRLGVHHQGANIAGQFVSIDDPDSHRVGRQAASVPSLKPILLLTHRGSATASVWKSFSPVTQKALLYRAAKFLQSGPCPRPTSLVVIDCDSVLGQQPNSVTNHPASIGHTKQATGLLSDDLPQPIPHRLIDVPDEIRAILRAACAAQGLMMSNRKSRPVSWFVMSAA